MNASPQVPLKILCAHCRAHIYDWAYPVPPQVDMLVEEGMLEAVNGSPVLRNGDYWLCPHCGEVPCTIDRRILTDQGVLPPLDNQEASAGEHPTTGPAEAP